LSKNLSGSQVIISGSTSLTGSLFAEGPVIISGSLANGINAAAIGVYSHAEGYSALASGSYSHAEGYSTFTSGTYSHAEGESATADGYASHAEGSNTLASGASSHVEGSFTQAIGAASHAEGQETQAIGYASHAEGEQTLAIGDNSHAEGNNSQAIGTNSHAEGAETKTGVQNAYYATSVIDGLVTLSSSYGNVASEFSEGSFLLLYDSFGDNNYGISTFEIKTTAYNAPYTEIELVDTSVNTTVARVGDINLIGYWTGDQIVPGSDAHSEGFLSIAIGSNSHAEGYEGKAVGNYSHAEGENTLAIGVYSHAEGYQAQTIGDNSHAEGQDTLAKGFASHAESYMTIASGSWSHAEGFTTIALGDHSHAEGDNTQAIGYASHAEGHYTIASGDRQHVQGQYNISSSAQSAFIIGNGTSDLNRSNLVFASGSSFQITGSLKVSGSITASNALITGTITAQTLVVQTITSSITYSSGSNIFGNKNTDTHQFTGSVLAPSITGSLQGTSSWAVSASWAPSSPAVATISSYIATGSVTASVNTDISASFRVTSGSNTLLNVTKDGFVWIGNGSFTNQAYQLDVIGTARIKTDLYVHNSSGEARLEIGRSSIGPRIILYGDDGSSGLVYYSSSFSNYIYDYNASTNNLSFQTSGSTRLRINSTGLATFLNGLSVTGSLDVSGSSKFGRLVTNTHQFTGSLLAPSITGSLQGTSSWANNAITSSYPISVTGSNIYSVSPLANVPNALIAQNNIFLGLGAGTSSNNGIESNFIGYYAGSDSTASYSNFIGSLAGSSATNAQGSNFIGFAAGGGATNAYSSNFIGYFVGNAATNAHSSNFIGTGGGNATNASYSNFIGNLAGTEATNASESNFIGTSAGTFARNSSFSNFIGSYAGSNAISAFNSNFIGVSAGSGASSASYSNFIGQESGLSAPFSEFSNFIGYNSGYYAVSASYSNFIGLQSGFYAPSASFCTLIGYRAGSSYSGYGLFSSKGIGSNNIIIGNFITLPEGTRDSINLGGIIFATGSYFNPDPNSAFPQTYPLSGSANGKVGINIVSPTQELDVSGSVQISQLLILPPQDPLPLTAPIGSIASSGSGANCKPYFWNGSTWTSMI
jgi:hypothetical protein